MAFATPPIASRSVPFLIGPRLLKECRNCPGESCHVYAVLLEIGEVPDVCERG
jgi:hypothetical protein